MYRHIHTAPQLPEDGRPAPRARAAPGKADQDGQELPEPVHHVVELGEAFL
jgi:hypothetical protein